MSMLLNDNCLGKFVGKGFRNLREIEKQAGVNRIFVDCDNIAELVLISIYIVKHTIRLQSTLKK